MKLETSNLANKLATVGPNEKMQNQVKWVVIESHDVLLKYWDPSISPERLQLETSNLANKLATVGPNEKMQNQVKWVVKGSRDLLFEISRPPRYLGNG